MNRKTAFAMAMGAASMLAPALTWGDDPTPAPAASQVQTHLRLELGNDVKEVHYINTNSDPWIYTKVYVLKNADPYELRPYLINAVGGVYSTANVENINIGRRVNTSTTKVECIKYMDGTGMMIVSAEDYRFSDNTNGMSIDEIVNILDQPGVTSSSGHKYWLYLPKYRDAASLQTAIRRSGMNGDNNVDYFSQYELEGGKDRVREDSALNGLLFYYPDYSRKNIESMLNLYDKPNPEALITYTVYEFDNEIDSQVGTDFQAWKNGPGTDLFAVASRYTNGWNVTQMAAARPYVNNGHARFFNFSPKWNTKYIDLLASKGKAQVVTSGAIAVGTNTTGYVGSTVRVNTIQTGAARANSGITQIRYYRDNGINLNNVNFTVGANTTVPVTAGGVSLANPPFKRNDGSDAAITGNFMITESQWTTYDGNGNTRIDYTYYMQIETTNGGGFTACIFDSNGKNLGTDVKVFSDTPGSQINFTTAGAGGAAVTWTTAGANSDPYAAIAIQHANQRDTAVNAITTAGDNYGFEMTVAPTVNEEQTTVGVTLTNTNLVGFNSDGTIRTTRTQVQTSVDVNNKGEKFVIGGLDKEQVLRGQSGLPWLDNIPVVGWAIGAERETHKKSQIVAVIECVPVVPDTSVPAGVMSEISLAKEKIKNYGVKAGDVINENDYGFEQFLLDADKKSLDPLP